MVHFYFIQMLFDCQRFVCSCEWKWDWKCRGVFCQGKICYCAFDYFCFNTKL